MSRPRIYDDLMNAPRETVGHSAFLLLDRGQDMTPAVHTLAAAIHLILIAEHHKVPVQDVFTAAKNLMTNHDDRLGTDFEAIRTYLKEEGR